MNSILRLKHWQVFGIIFLIPMLLQMSIFIPFYLEFIRNLMLDVQQGREPNPEEEYFAGFIRIFKWMLLPGVLSIFGLVAWMWATGNFLHKKLPPNVQMPVGRFRAALLFYGVYGLVVLIAAYMLLDTVTLSNPETFAAIPQMVLIGMPVYLLAIVAMFYAYYFLAKALKAVESEGSSNDFFVNFLLFWIYPIGVWFVQPTINRLAAEQNNDIVSV